MPAVSRIFHATLGLVLAISLEAAPDSARSVTIPVTLDRFEGNIAVLYWGEGASDKVDVPAKYLPRDCPEGTSLRVTIAVDAAATRRLQKRLRALQPRLRRE